MTTVSMDNIPIKPCANITFGETKNSYEYKVSVAHPREDLVSSVAPGAFIRVFDGDSVYHAGIVTHAAFANDILEVCYINEGTA